MYQSWQHLLFLHWSVTPRYLSSLLPPNLHLDTYEGRAWLGIVPFFMKNVRPRFLPAVPGLSNFLELNVRTYVFDDDGVPGVWFFSLDASNPLACRIARTLFHLPYREATMRAQLGDTVDYTALRHGAGNTARYQYLGVGPAATASPGTLEFFLLERYVLYAYAQKSQQLYRGRVHHPPYQFQEAKLGEHSTAPVAWNGLEEPTGAPDHVCYSSGVDVSVYNLRKV